MSTRLTFSNQMMDAPRDAVSSSTKSHMRQPAPFVSSKTLSSTGVPSLFGKIVNRAVVVEAVVIIKVAVGTTITIIAVVGTTIKVDKMLVDSNNNLVQASCPAHPL